MSESTTSHPENPEPSKTSSPSTAWLGVAKLVLAGLCSVVAVVMLYRSATKEDKVEDPVAIQAEIDRADTIIDQKEEIKNGFRYRYVTHKSGKVDVFSENLNPPQLPTSSGQTGSAKGKGASKKKTDDAVKKDEDAKPK